MHNKLKELLGWPALIVTCLLSIAGILTFFGFSLKSPAESMDDQMQMHMFEERAFHSIQMFADTNISIKLDTAFVVLMNMISDIAEVKEHIGHLEERQDKALRGECLENTHEQLVLQGLILDCRRLGVDR